MANSSMQDTCDKTVEIVQKTFQTISKFWDEIGYSGEKKSHFRNVMYNHFEDLCKSMVEEVHAEKNQLHDDILNLMDRLNDLQKTLNLVIPKFSIEDNTPLLETQQILIKKIEKYEKLYQQKKSAIIDLNKKAFGLENLLGNQDHNSLSVDKLPDEKIVELFKNYIIDLENQKFKREEEFLKLKEQIEYYIDELKIAPNLNYQIEILESSRPLITNKDMDNIRTFHKIMEQQFLDIKEQIDDYRLKLNTIWELLEVDLSYRSQFSNTYQGYSCKVLEAVKNEYKLCEEKKKENIKVYIDRLRDQIKETWDSLKFGQMQKSKDFKHIYSDIFNEDLLSLHELYLDKIKQRYENNKQLYQLLDKRNDFWYKKMKLENIIESDVNRYKNRGGKLLEEERERRLIEKKLPHIEEKIRELAIKYEEKNGKPFIVYDQPIIDYVTQSWNSFNKKKNDKLSAKKIRDKTLTPSVRIARSRSPTPSRLHIPSAKRNILTPSINSTRKEINKNSTGKKPHFPVLTKIKRFSGTKRRHSKSLTEAFKNLKANDENEEEIETYPKFFEGSRGKKRHSKSFTIASKNLKEKDVNVEEIDNYPNFFEGIFVKKSQDDCCQSTIIHELPKLSKAELKFLKEESKENESP